MKKGMVKIIYKRKGDKRDLKKLQTIKHAEYRLQNISQNFSK